MSRSQYPGRRPAKPPTVAEAIDEIIVHTNKWRRRYAESWFDQNFDLNDDESYDGNDDQNGIPAIELGIRPAGDLDAIPELCDEAIEAVAQLAEFAEEAGTKLAEVKKDAERRIEQRRSGAGEPPHQNGEKI